MFTISSSLFVPHTTETIKNAVPIAVYKNSKDILFKGQEYRSVIKDISYLNDYEKYILEHSKCEKYEIIKGYNFWGNEIINIYTYSCD